SVTRFLARLRAKRRYWAPRRALDWDKWRAQINQIGAAESGASVFPVRAVGSRTIAAIRARCLLGTAPADQFGQTEDRLPGPAAGQLETPRWSIGGATLG